MDVNRASCDETLELWDGGAGWIIAEAQSLQQNPDLCFTDRASEGLKVTERERV